MPRVTNGSAHHQRRNKTLKLAKGFRGRRKNAYRVAKTAVIHALSDSYRGRRTKKRDFRSLWIVRIGAAVRPYSLSYSKFIHKLNEKNIIINRKILANLALNEPEVFQKIVDELK